MFTVKNKVTEEYLINEWQEPELFESIEEVLEFVEIHEGTTENKLEIVEIKENENE